MNNSLRLPRRHRSAWLIPLLAVVWCNLSIFSYTQGTPSAQLIPFQGRLTNQEGVPYDNGQYTITLNLYSQAIGGSTVWTERHEKVSVIGGMLNLFLGSISPFDIGTPSVADDVNFSTTKYLGITVDADNNPATADPEMVPRTMIVAAFYAKNSEKLAGNDWTSFVTDSGGSPSNDPASGYLNAAKILPASITVDQIQDAAVTSQKIADGTIAASDLSPTLQADSLIPTGSVMPFAGTVAPTGWAFCDGSSHPSNDPLYARLYGIIGITHGGNASSFNLPDYRGRFLRGVDGTGGRDPDRAARASMKTGGNAGNLVGSVQGEAFKNHNHQNSTFASPDHRHWTSIGSGGNSSTIYSNNDRYGSRVVTSPVGGAHVGGVFDPSSVGPRRESSTDVPTASATVAAEGGNETRPINAYVNYIIKL